MAEFEGGRDPKIKIPEIRIDSPEIIFGVDVGFDEHVGSLEEVCNVGNFDEVRKLLRHNKFIENVVIRKGKNKELLALLERAVNILAQQEIGKNVSEISDVQELERVIKSGKLPPFAVAELAGAFYHLNRDDESEGLAKLLIGTEDSAVDSVSRAHALNCMSSVYFRQGDAQGALDANKTALTLTTKSGISNSNAKWIELKVRHGIVIDQGQLKRGKEDYARMLEESIGKLFKYKRLRQDIGDTYHLGRVDFDAAEMFLKLGKVDQAIHFATEGRNQMQEVGYISMAQQAEEFLRQMGR